MGDPTPPSGVSARTLYHSSLLRPRGVWCMRSGGDAVLVCRSGTQMARLTIFVFHGHWAGQCPGGSGWHISAPVGCEAFTSREMAFDLDLDRFPWSLGSFP